MVILQKDEKGSPRKSAYQEIVHTMMLWWPNSYSLCSNEPVNPMNSNTVNNMPIVAKLILDTDTGQELRFFSFIPWEKSTGYKEKLREITKGLIIHETMEKREFSTHAMLRFFFSLPGRGYSSNLQWSAYCSKQQATQIPASSTRWLLWISPDHQYQKNQDQEEEEEEESNNNEQLPQALSGTQLHLHSPCWFTEK